MKPRLLMLAGVGCILVAMIVLWHRTDPIHKKLLLGCARVLKKQIPVTLEVDDRKIQGVRCFVEPGEFGNHRSRGLVLWVEDPRAVLGYHILIVDLDNKKIISPNSGDRNYRLLGNKRLIQSDSGAVGVAFGDSKLDDGDPNFQRSGNLISFTIPPVLDLPSGRWKVRIDANESI